MPEPTTSLNRNELAEKRNFLLLSFFCAAYIFLFCWIGRYTFPIADDFWNAHNLIANGFWPSQWQMYFSWSGRLTSTFFMYVAYFLGIENIYPFLASFTTLLNLTVIFFLLRAILTDESKWKLLSLSLLFQAVWLASNPALNEVFYWLNGSFYNWTAILAVLSLAMSIQVLREWKGGMFFAALLGLVFFNGMMIEMMTAAQVGVALFFTLYFLWRKQYQSTRRMVFILTATLCALLVTLTAPGNFVRFGSRQIFSAGKLFHIFGVVGVFDCVTTFKFFASPMVWVLLLYMPTIAKAIPPFDAKVTAFLRLKHIALIIILVAAINQATHVFAIETPLPPRGEGLAMWMMTTVWLFLWIFGYRNEKLFAKIEKLKVYPWRNLILVLCLLLSSNFIALARNIGIAPLYAREVEERYASTEQQKREGKKEIFLPTLQYKPALIFYRDFTLSPHCTPNDSYGKYRGVDAVIAYPRALMSNSEDFASLQDVIERLKIAADDGDLEVLFKLGELYDSLFPFPAMDGFSKDNTLAAQYYLQAARRGYTPAQRRLIRVYATEAGVPRNYFRALEWLLRSQF